MTKALQPFDKGYTHFCVDVTDIEQEYERLKGLGMTFSQPGPIDVGHVKSIYGRDPEGNLIEIPADRSALRFPAEQIAAGRQVARCGAVGRATDRSQTMLRCHAEARMQASARALPLRYPLTAIRFACP